MFEECNDDGAGEDFKHLVSSLSPDSVEEVDYLFFFVMHLFELRMMKIFKVSRTDIAGKTLLQWLVEYDADVHIKILLDAGYSTFQIFTKHKTKLPLFVFFDALNIRYFPKCHPSHYNMNI